MKSHHLYSTPILQGPNIWEMRLWEPSLAYNPSYLVTCTPSTSQQSLLRQTGGQAPLPLPPPQPPHTSQLPSPHQKSLPFFKANSNASSSKKSPLSLSQGPEHWTTFMWESHLDYGFLLSHGRFCENTVPNGMKLILPRAQLPVWRKHLFCHRRGPREVLQDRKAGWQAAALGC